MDEHCPECDRTTPHKVGLQRRQESDAETDPSGFGVEPYRVATCRECGNERTERMH